jgi:hypothetical protein
VLYVGGVSLKLRKTHAAREITEANINRRQRGSLIHTTASRGKANNMVKPHVGIANKPNACTARQRDTAALLLLVNHWLTLVSSLCHDRCTHDHLWRRLHNDGGVHHTFTRTIQFVEFLADGTHRTAAQYQQILEVGATLHCERRETTRKRAKMGPTVWVWTNRKSQTRPYHNADGITDATTARIRAQSTNGMV